ncbi:MAG: hypothetical protein V1835_07400 [Candidatus Micrarchaeota archaeon]
MNLDFGAVFGGVAKVLGVSDPIAGHGKTRYYITPENSAETMIFTVIVVIVGAYLAFTGYNIIRTGKTTSKRGTEITGPVALALGILRLLIGVLMFAAGIGLLGFNGLQIPWT